MKISKAIETKIIKILREKDITVNKLAETKDCEVKVDVSALTDYTVKTEEVEIEDEDGKIETVEKEIEAEKVTVVIYVNGNEYDRGNTKQDDTAYTRTVSDKGTITIKIEIKDSEGKTLATKTKTSINLNETNSVVFK